MNDLGLIIAYLYPGKEGYYEVHSVDGITRWDAATLGPRPTQAQIDAARLPAHRKQKKDEGARRMHRENRALYPEVSEVEGAWVAEAMIDLITEPRGIRVASIKANKDKRARFYVLVEAATTVEAVQALAWEQA